MAFELVHDDVRIVFVDDPLVPLIIGCPSIGGMRNLTLGEARSLRVLMRILVHDEDANSRRLPA